MTLLDETDTRIRVRQHGSIFAGIALLAVSRALVDTPAVFWPIVLVGLALLVLSATFQQHWTLDYRGHTVDYWNNPLRGERLFVDGKKAGGGKLGVNSEMRAPIGNGDTVVTRSVARLLSLRCHIFVESSDSRPPAVGISDDELLAEVQRRGLRT